LALRALVGIRAPRFATNTASTQCTGLCAAGTSLNFAAVDCILSSSYYFKIFFYIALPVLCFLLPKLIFSTILFLCKRRGHVTAKTTQFFKDVVIVTMLVAIFLVYPTVTKELFEFFSLETYELWEPESDALGQILQKGRKLRVVKKDLSAVVETIDDIVAGLTVSPSAVRTPVSEDSTEQRPLWPLLPLWRRALLHSTCAAAMGSSQQL
jgi:hypothetical protein